MESGWSASSSGPASGRRYALVIGNRAYTTATPLQSPRADALTMASLLENIGFEVQIGFDCTFSEFRQRLRDFADRIGDAGVALFYFSGHAVAARTSNHLLPIDAEVHEDEDLGRVTISLDRVLGAMQKPGRVCLVFLDACHDDPFSAHSPRNLTKGILASHAGLRSVPAGNLPETLIGFAAEEGRAALDGGSGLSPFTAALKQELARPGAEIQDIMREVRRRVVSETEGRQQPWFKDKLTRPVVLVPHPGADAEAKPEFTPPPEARPDKAVERATNPRWSPGREVFKALLAAGLVAVLLAAFVASREPLPESRACIGTAQGCLDQIRKSGRSGAAIGGSAGPLKGN
jgi:uncharacterized caspase-like protein